MLPLLVKIGNGRGHARESDQNEGVVVVPYLCGDDAPETGYGDVTREFGHGLVTVFGGANVIARRRVIVRTSVNKSALERRVALVDAIETGVVVIDGRLSDVKSKMTILSEIMRRQCRSLKNLRK